MTEEVEGSPDTAEAQQVIDTDIVQSADFTHFSADSGTVTDLGHDFEIGFLRVSPRAVMRRVDRGDGNKVQIRFSPENVEVARARLSPGVALQVAMNIMERLVEGDHVHVDGLRSAFLEVLDRTSDDAGQSDD